MTPLIILAATLVIAFFAISRVLMSEEESVDEVKKYVSPYKYRKKKSLVTSAELIFYKALTQAVGDKYQIFAQVHLSSIFDHTTYGQNWKGALSHIQRKSVDFVLCDKINLSPMIAIELDDRSHERWDRVARDMKVEAIFKAVGIPLLRLKQVDTQDIENLKQKIESSIEGPKS